MNIPESAILNFLDVWTTNGYIFGVLMYLAFIGLFLWAVATIAVKGFKFVRWFTQKRAEKKEAERRYKNISEENNNAEK